MRQSGAIIAGMHQGLRDIIKPGISTWEIETFSVIILKVTVDARHRLALKAMNMPRLCRLTMKSLTHFPVSNYS